MVRFLSFLIWFGIAAAPAWAQCPYNEGKCPGPGGCITPSHKCLQRSASRMYRSLDDLLADPKLRKNFTADDLVAMRQLHDAMGEYIAEAAKEFGPRLRKANGDMRFWVKFDAEGVVKALEILLRSEDFKGNPANVRRAQSFLLLLGHELKYPGQTKDIRKLINEVRTDPGMQVGWKTYAQLLAAKRHGKMGVDAPRRTGARTETGMVFDVPVPLDNIKKPALRGMPPKTEPYIDPYIRGRVKIRADELSRLQGVLSFEKEYNKSTKATERKIQKAEKALEFARSELQKQASQPQPEPKGDPPKPEDQKKAKQVAESLLDTVEKLMKKEGHAAGGGDEGFSRLEREGKE